MMQSCSSEDPIMRQRSDYEYSIEIDYQCKKRCVYIFKFIPALK